MVRTSVALLMLLLFRPVALAAPAATADSGPRPLSGGQGYVVLDLLLKQRVTEIVFTRGGRNNITFGPYEKGRHLLLLPLPKGEFRLDRVASPSYDLPFRQFYSGYDRLKFKVLPGRINYFAQILVGDIRSAYGFEIHVRNRLAYSYGELTEKYGPLLAQFPIHYGGSITDHFYNEFFNPEKREADE